MTSSITLIQRCRFSCRVFGRPEGAIVAAAQPPPFVDTSPGSLGCISQFSAGTIRRAPLSMRKLGLEWLWRIKRNPTFGHVTGTMEPVLLRLLFTHVLPSAFWTSWLRLRCERSQDLMSPRSSAVKP